MMALTLVVFLTASVDLVLLTDPAQIELDMYRQEIRIVSEMLEQECPYYNTTGVGTASTLGALKVSYEKLVQTLAQCRRCQSELTELSACVCQLLLLAASLNFTNLSSS